MNIVEQNISVWKDFLYKSNEWAKGWASDDIPARDLKAELTISHHTIQTAFFTMQYNSLHRDVKAAIGSTNTHAVQTGLTL